MKLFNLEKALAGEPVITRDGREAEIGSHKEGADLQLVGWILIGDQWRSTAWRADGRSVAFTPAEHDLFMAPQKKTMWIRCYVDVDGRVIVRSDDYKDSAIFKESMILSNCKWIDPEPWPHEVSI